MPREIVTSSPPPPSADAEPAWVDDDDENTDEVVNIAEKSHLRKLRTPENGPEITRKELVKRLRTFHESLHQPSWAALPDDNQDEEKGSQDLAPEAPMKRKIVTKPAKKDLNDFLNEATSALYQSSAKITTNATRVKAASGKSRKPLPAGSIEIYRVPDATVSRSSKAVVTTVRFHSNELLMSAGMDKTLKMYHIDCDKNPVVQSLLFEDTQIYCADFVQNNTEAIVGGRRKELFVCNFTTNTVRPFTFPNRKEISYVQFKSSYNQEHVAFIGNDNSILIMNSDTKSLIGEIRGPDGMADIAWSFDDQWIFAVGNDGKVYIYDVQTRTAIYQFADHGSDGGTAIASSPNGKYIAVGSKSGVVNVYDTNFEHFKITNDSKTSTDSFTSYFTSYASHISSAKQPLKALMQLTTPVNKIVFSPTSEILAIGSRAKKDALRLIHIGTLTALTGWPTVNTPLNYVQDVTFSPDSSLFAVANSAGKVLMYELSHYAGRRRK